MYLTQLCVWKSPGTQHTDLKSLCSQNCHSSGSLDNRLMSKQPRVGEVLGTEGTSVRGWAGVSWPVEKVGGSGARQ